MKEDFKYPIKYAVQELKQRGGWSVGYKNITQGFIVSKCYVVGSNIKYFADGSYKINHKVVFPFDDIEGLKISLRHGRNYIGDENFPAYDACDRPRTTTVVNSLFDSYADAKVVAELKNEEYKRDLILEISILDSDWKEKYNKLLDDFDERLRIANIFEKLTLCQTEDLIVTEDFDTNHILKVLSYKKNNML